MSKSLIGLLLTVLCSVAQAENYSVCVNCRLAEAKAEYFSAHYPGDYTGFAIMSYYKRKVTRLDKSVTIELGLKKFECLDTEMCYPGLTEPAELTFLDGRDPIDFYDPSKEYKPIYVRAKIKLGGHSRDIDCHLGQTPDSEGKYGYSFQYGVAVNCIFSLENQLNLNLNLDLKRVN